MPALPLEGVRVLDLSTVLAAPVTATFLGDFGAEVVKVEEPGRGDFTRGLTPGARSPHWAQEARNKRSVTIDLRTAAGQGLVRRLVPHFDVVVANFRPPTMAAWGLDPATLSALAPRAVICCVTAYGLTGPYAGRGAFDRIASSFSGLTHVSGYEDAPPVRSGYAVIDYMSAYLAAFGVMVALYHRDVHGGPGQVLDLALYESGFRAAEDSLVRYATTGAVRERSGNVNPHVVPATDVVAADGRRVSVHAGTDTLFAKLCTVMGAPDLAERYPSRQLRFENAAEVYAALASWAATRSADEVVGELSAVNIPSAPVMTTADIAADPHYRARGSIVDVPDPDFGTLPMPAPFPHLSVTPGSVRSTGPALGEGTDEILTALLGLTADELTDLHAAGVV